MALSGNLEELAVLDVIQFANHAHLSGCLQLRRNGEQADLFYRKGGLVHAQLGKTAGPEVLVQIVDWSKGEFEFRTGVDTADETIRMDLHRAVMHALKTRDERKQEAERRAADQAKAAQKVTPTVAEQLRQMIAPLDFIQNAAIFDAGGLLGVAHRNGARGEDMEPLCRSLMSFVGAHPRGQMKRAILDDANGTLILSQVPVDRWLVVAAVKGVTLGAVTVGMGRLIARLSAAQPNGNQVLQSTPG